MKKIFIAVVAGVFAFCVGSAAQSYTDSRLGIVAGFTSSSSTVKDVDTKSISLYHAGLAFEIPLGGGFAIQPEAIYQVKGMSLSNRGNSTSKDVRNSFETKVGYLEVPVQIQWGPDLLAFRPYGFIEPFIGYQISASDKSHNNTINEELQRMEYGLSLGAGLEIWKLQVSAKYFWNFGSVYNSDVAKTGETIGGVLDGNNFNGVAVSVALFF